MAAATESMLSRRRSRGISPLASVSCASSAMAVLVPMVSKKSTSSTATKSGSRWSESAPRRSACPTVSKRGTDSQEPRGSEATPAMSDTKVPKPIPIRIEPFTRRAISAAITSRLAMAALMARRVKGSILIGIGFGTLVSLIAGVASLPRGSWLSVPRFDTVGQADLRGALSLHLLPLFVAVLLVDFFDTIGTSTAIAEEAQLTDANGEIPRLRRLLSIDSVAAAIGGLFGASSVTSYIESAAGVAEGARTGLHSVVVAVMFTLAIFATPIAGIVPAAAAAFAADFLVSP